MSQIVTDLVAARHSVGVDRAAVDDISLRSGRNSGWEVAVSQGVIANFLIK
jgi:hypothetical protein